MPYTTRADGDVLTASSHNANCRDQVISTVTSGTRPAGTEGQFIYETDTDLVYVYNGGWVQFGGVGAWTSYTPTLTQSATVTKTVNYAKYFKIGRMCQVTVSLTVTGAGTATNAITIGLPLAAATAIGFGGGYFYDGSGNALYPGISTVLTTTTAVLVDASAATPAAAWMSIAPFRESLIWERESLQELRL
jgi:hypothetical protein